MPEEEMRRSERLQMLGYEPPDQSDWVTGLHPMDDLLRGERLPHIWCQGCGLGTALTTFIAALKWLEENRGWDLDKVAVVSGIGCTGRIAGYVRLDSFHTTHGRAIPFATGLKLANPELKVVVLSGDGDIAGIGGNHFIHAARRNLDITVVCVNNFNYGMTGGQAGQARERTPAPDGLSQESPVERRQAGAAGAHRGLSTGAAAADRAADAAKHHLNRYPVPDWVHQQVYLHPYPKELMLRNHV